MCKSISIIHFLSSFLKIPSTSCVISSFFYNMKHLFVTWWTLQKRNQCLNTRVIHMFSIKNQVTRWYGVLAIIIIRNVAADFIQLMIKLYKQLMNRIMSQYIWDRAANLLWCPAAWHVRRPGQAEILGFGLACFGPDTAVPGQPELVDPVSFFLNNYHSLCTNFFPFFIFILSFITSISIQWHLEYFSHFIWSTFYFSLCFPSLFAFRYLSCRRLFLCSFLFVVFSFAIFYFGHFSAYSCTIIIMKYKWKVWSVAIFWLIM